MEISSRRINKQVFSIFYLYLGIYYLFPFIMNIFYPKEYSDLYVGTESSWPIVYVVFTVFLVFLINTFLPRVRIFSFEKIAGIFENTFLNAVIITVCFGTAVQFALNYSLNFRQSSAETISGAGGYVMVMFGLLSYVKVFFLYLILKFANNLEITRSQRRLALLSSISIVISVTGSLDLLFASIGILIAFKRERIFFDKIKNPFKRLKAQFFRIFTISVIVIVIIFVGNANKMGVETTVGVFSNTNNSGKIFLHTTKRISVWYVSVLALGNQDVFNNDIAFQTLQGVFENLYSRANIIFGGRKDDIDGVWSVKRMNFLQISQFTYNDRTGTAPGLVASSFYLPYFPFNFFLVAFYTVIMLRYFSKGFEYSRYSLNIFSKFVFLFFFIGLFDSPIDLINFISPNFIFIVLFLGTMDKINKLSLVHEGKSLKNQKSINNLNVI